LKLLYYLIRKINKKKVLIVDDEPHIREELGHFLRKKYKVFTAATREDAKKIIEQKMPDFVIIDLNLDTESEYSGLILLDWLIKNYPKIKPLVLSAYSPEHVRESEDFRQRKETVELVVENNYISKGSRPNYIEAVQKKIEELEQSHE
jgi:DNA-binding NtrC family response regulator